jgi:hypothetical protein
LRRGAGMVALPILMRFVVTKDSCRSLRLTRDRPGLQYGNVGRAGRREQLLYEGEGAYDAVAGSRSVLLAGHTCPVCTDWNRQRGYMGSPLIPRYESPYFRRSDKMPNIYGRIRDLSVAITARRRRGSLLFLGGEPPVLYKAREPLSKPLFCLKCPLVTAKALL